ncbi:MAG: AarF/UbiB family protein [Acidimicrobiia bacterium]
MTDRTARQVSRWAMARRSIRAGWMFVGILAAYLVYLGWRRVVGREAAKSLSERTHRRGARRLHRGILRLEGVYIKIGQVLSMMTSFLPDAYLEELEGLQDSVPPRPFDAIAARVEAELGAPITTSFPRFEQRPVASASLGQVHFAAIADGTPVAVKVQYPGVERIVATDLAMIRLVVKVIGWFLEGLRSDRIYDDLSSTIRAELVYTNEGANAEAIAANFSDDDHVRFPAIVWDHTTDRVLTMERMEGRKITDVAGLRDDGIEPRDVIEKLVQSYFKQLLVDRLYHADPHPGNFFVTRHVDAKPVITFLDFGAVAEFPDEFAEGMRTVVFGYMTRDDAKVIEGIKAMGFASIGGDEAVFETAVRHYLDKLLNLRIEDFSDIDLREFDVWRNLDEMELSFRDLTRSFEVPRHWFYVERTLALLLGLCARLDPKVDAFVYGFPYAVEFVFGSDSKLAALWGTTSAPRDLTASDEA